MASAKKPPVAQLNELVQKLWTPPGTKQEKLIQWEYEEPQAGSFIATVHIPTIKYRATGAQEVGKKAAQNDAAEVALRHLRDLESGDFTRATPSQMESKELHFEVNGPLRNSSQRPFGGVDPYNSNWDRIGVSENQIPTSSTHYCVPRTFRSPDAEALPFPDFAPRPVSPRRTEVQSVFSSSSHDIESPQEVRKKMCETLKLSQSAAINYRTILLQLLQKRGRLITSDVPFIDWQFGDAPPNKFIAHVKVQLTEQNSLSVRLDPSQRLVETFDGKVASSKDTAKESAAITALVYFLSIAEESEEPVDQKTMSSISDTAVNSSSVESAGIENLNLLLQRGLRPSGQKLFQFTSILLNGKYYVSRIEFNPNFVDPETRKTEGPLGVTGQPRASKSLSESSAADRAFNLFRNRQLDIVSQMIHETCAVSDEPYCEQFKEGLLKFKGETSDIKNHQSAKESLSEDSENSRIHQLPLPIEDASNDSSRKSRKTLSWSTPGYVSDDELEQGSYQDVVDLHSMCEVHSEDNSIMENGLIEEYMKAFLAELESRNVSCNILKEGIPAKWVTFIKSPDFTPNRKEYWSNDHSQLDWTIGCRLGRRHNIEFDADLNIAREAARRGISDGSWIIDKTSLVDEDSQIHAHDIAAARSLGQEHGKIMGPEGIVELDSTLRTPIEDRLRHILDSSMITDKS